jgi:hypothetical protein
MTNSPILDQARAFIMNNARLLERRRFSFLFEGGCGQLVLQALLAYQNADGGFGNALEPDKRCEESQPVDQEVALGVMDEIGVDQAAIHRMCDLLLTISTSEGGVPFVLPTVANAARAPWWNTPDNPPASINPTGGIVGLLHKYQFQHPWVDQATAFCWRKIASMQVDEPHNLVSALTFLQYVPDRDRAQIEFRRLSAQLMTSGLVALAPDASGYVFGPLAWSPTPHSLCRLLFSDELIAAHLDAHVNRQQADGGWAISWPAVSPACELEYRGILTINALKTPQAYDRLALLQRA